MDGRRLEARSLSANPSKVIVVETVFSSNKRTFCSQGRIHFFRVFCVYILESYFAEVSLGNLAAWVSDHNCHDPPPREYGGITEAKSL